MRALNKYAEIVLYDIAIVCVPDEIWIENALHNKEQITSVGGGKICGFAGFRQKTKGKVNTLAGSGIWGTHYTVLQEIQQD